MPTYPISEEHFNAGANLHPGSGQGPDEALPAILNDLDDRSDTAEADVDALQAGKTNTETLTTSGTIAATSANVVLDTASGVVTATLPAAATAGLGREIFVTRIGATNNGVVQRAGSDTIGAAATSITLSADGAGTTLVAVSATRWAIKATTP